MYHTEGYIDKESVDSAAHMVSLAGKMQGKDILVWAVWKEHSQVKQHQERLKQWFLGELGMVIQENGTQIDRELMRISFVLGCRLYLYYCGHLYRAGDQENRDEYYIDPPLGACIHRSGTAMADTLEKELESLRRASEEERNLVEQEGTETEVQRMGNIWQKNIMDCVMEDGLSYAYFMLWEAR